MVVIRKKYISVGFGGQKLRERNKSLSILININNFMSTCLRPKEVLETAVSTVMEHFGFKAGRMYVMDKGGHSLTLAASRGVDTKGLERIRITEGFTGKAARTRSFIAQHVSELEDQERAVLLLGKGLEVIVCVPLIHLDRVLGVMNLGTDKSIRLSKAKIDLLVTIGNAIAVALSHTRLCEDLDRKIQELREKNETIEFFTFTASHDIKSPLIGIYGLTKLLARQYRDMLDERGKSYCDQILKASEQVVALVDSINTYVKSKESFQSVEKLNIQEMVQSIRTDFAGTLALRGIRWCQPEGLPEITADKTGIQRVFRNLVENALKYGGDGLTEIVIGYEEDPSYHIFSVGDDGVGITGEGADKLFKPFHRHKTSEGTEGTGLGLAIVKEIAERHGGRAWLKQRGSRGATFCFSVAKELENRESKPTD